MNPNLPPWIDQASLWRSFNRVEDEMEQEELYARAQYARAQQSHFAAQSQRQPRGYAETSKHALTFLPIFHASTDNIQVPESDEDRRTRRSTQTRRDVDPAEEMRANFARMNMMSGGLGERNDEQQSRRSSRRETESSWRADESRREAESFHRATEARHARNPNHASYRPVRRREPEPTYFPSEFPMRPRQSRRDRDSDHDLSDYRAETAAPPSRRRSRPVEQPAFLPFYPSPEETRRSRVWYREHGRQDPPSGSSRASMDPYEDPRYSGRRSRRDC